MLAKLYLGYLDELITWNEFAILAEMIDRLFIDDIIVLRSSYSLNTFNNPNADSILRLVGLGLLTLDTNATDRLIESERRHRLDGGINMFDYMESKTKYDRTGIGQKLVSVLERYNN